MIIGRGGLGVEPWCLLLKHDIQVLRKWAMLLIPISQINYWSTILKQRLWL